MTRVLVAGSYPPVPGPAAARTVAAVRREWDRGHEVTVVSPRPSAAHLRAHLQGVRAAWELVRLRRRLQLSRLVFCMEPGVPIAATASAGWQRWTGLLLAQALGRFEEVELVMTSDLPVELQVMGRLLRRADDVVVGSVEEARGVADRFTIPVDSIRVHRPCADQPRLGPPSSPVSDADPPVELIRQRAAAHREADQGPGTTTPLGPPEWTSREQPRRLVGVAARKLLGPQASTVRRWVIR
jgi:hypothetical protein